MPDKMEIARMIYVRWTGLSRDILIVKFCKVPFKPLHKLHKQESTDKNNFQWSFLSIKRLLRVSAFFFQLVNIARLAAMLIR